MLVGDDGGLVAWNMPDTLEMEVLDEVGAKIVRLRDAFRVVDENVDACVVRFAEHKLWLKAAAGGLLCVLARPDVNLPALRMAARVILRAAVPATMG